MLSRLPLALALLAPTAAFAAATGNNFITPQTPELFVQNFVKGTDPVNTSKTLVTGGANGTKITAISIALTDTSSNMVTCLVVRSTVGYPSFAVSVPAGSGSSPGAPPVSFTQQWTSLPIDSDGNRFIFLMSGDTLQCQYSSTLAATGAVIGLEAWGANY